MIYIIYSLLIVLCCYLGGKKKKGAYFYRVFACLAYICIVGFRHYSVGVDSERYMELFDYLPDQNYIWLEIGFDRLVRFLSSLGFTYTGLFFACIILTAIPIFLTLEKTDHYTFSAILFYILTLTSVTNGMRQCISVAIFVYGCYFIKERKIIPYLICIGFALLFHYSCIILLPLYFLLNRSMSSLIYTLVYAFSFVFCFADVSKIVEPLVFLISGLGRNYAEDFSYYAFGFGSLSILGFIFTTSINVLVFVIMIATDSFKKYPLLSNCVFISLVLKNMTFSMPIIGRIALFFSWFMYLLIPILVSLNKPKQLLLFARVAICLLLSVGFVHNVTSSEMQMMPYKTSIK